MIRRSIFRLFHFCIALCALDIKRFLIPRWKHFSYHPFFNVSMRMKKGLRRCFLIIMIFNIIHQVMTFFFFLTFRPSTHQHHSTTHSFIEIIFGTNRMKEEKSFKSKSTDGWKVWWRFTHKSYHWNKKSIYTNWDRGEHRWNAFLSQKKLYKISFIDFC